MSRRKEVRTVTRTVETRIEFGLADLKKRLRLPEDAQLAVEVVESGIQLKGTYDVGVVGGLVATFTRTNGGA